ncbi:PEPxxWA-CTERM sorting domain-containing protein [Sphingomonas sp. ID0503]|uniref:PEPxxWA-CTERM sorting domain-containing protein n=1 Tax=Sphingomonas sp. ID0503 TaxID=3399691 RepID=UPI003AFA95F7
MKHAYLSTGVALVLALGVAQPASALVKITNVATTKGSKAGTVSYFGSGRSVNAGQFLLTGKDLDTNAAVSLKTFCIDIFNTLKTGTFTRTDDVNVGGQYAAKQDQVMALLGNVSITSADTSAAVQLAVWEIAYETSTTKYSLSDGWFSASGSSLSAAKTLANGYLSKVTKGDWKALANTQLNSLTADGNQDQIWLGTRPPQAPGAVPEPASWAMMIAGFGLIGGAMRRRSVQARFA